MFKGLAPPDFEKLESIIEEKSFVAGHKLFATGDDATSFYIIKSGEVRIVNDTQEPEAEIATLREGDFFGEMGVVEGSPRMAGAVMSQAGTLFEIEAHEFHRFMAINPSISMKIMSTMSKRYRVKQRASTSEEPRGPGKVVAMFAATGGVGTSLTAANLAYCIHEATGDRVVVLDLDLMFGDQTGIFDIGGSKSLAAIVDEPEIGSETLGMIVEASAHGVDVVPAPPKVIDAASVTADLVRVVLEVLRASYDWVVVDTTHDIAETNLSLFESCDEAIFVLTPEVLAIKNAVRWISVMDMCNLDSSDVRLVVNKELSGDVTMRDDIEKTVGRPILSTLPFDFKSARTSLNRGELLCADSGEPTKLQQAFQELAASITGLQLKAPEARPKGGLWDRLTSWAK
jgi:pilus assembly protein CpaE